MRKYKGITFAEGYYKPFADFKEEFASTHVFKNIPENKREAELKKAYKIASDGNTKKPESKSEESNRK